MASRPLTLTFTNGTGQTLTFQSTTVTSGTTPTATPSSFSSSTSTVFMTNEHSKGPSGVFAWNLPNGGGSFTVQYTHPFSASPTLVRFLSIPAGFEVLTTADNLNHHAASASYTLCPA